MYMDDGNEKEKFIILIYVREKSIGLGYHNPDVVKLNNLEIIGALDYAKQMVSVDMNSNNIKDWISLREQQHAAEKEKIDKE